MSNVPWQIIPEPEYVENDRQAVALLRTLMRKVVEEPGDLIGFDTETHGKKLPFTVGNSKPLDWMSDTVIFWSLSCKLDGEYRRWCLQQRHFQTFAGLLENPQAWLVAWNAKYDAHVSWNSGINLWEAKIVDGLVLAYLFDENRNDHGLKSCAEDWRGLHMTKYKDMFGDRDEHGNKVKEYETSLLDLPLDKVVDYASYDAYAALVTVEWLIERLSTMPLNYQDKHLWDHFKDTEMDITRILWRMERYGLGVDIEYLNSKIPEISIEIDKVTRDINRMVGKPVNVDAPKQLSELFFGDKTCGGMGLKALKLTKSGAQASTNKDVLNALDEAGVELASMVLRARKLNKIRSTYLTTLKALAEYYEDGRIHPNFHQHGARTGRFSTTCPNSQNFPRPDEDEWGIRKAFVAPDGKKLIVSDYEQLEMRIMADRAQDPVMIKAIQDGKDLHCFTVAKMNPKVTYDEAKAAKEAKDNKEATKYQLSLCQLRQDMKAVGFGIIYGAGPPNISQRIKISDDEIEQRMLKMGDKELGKRMSKLMRKNPLFTEEKARITVVRQAVAADKIAAYFQVFPDVKTYMDAIPEECRASVVEFPVPEDPHHAQKLQRHGDYYEGYTQDWGFVRTLVGRYRRLEEIDHRDNWIMRGHAEREAVNVTIQGTAADIVKAAMLLIDSCPRLRVLGAHLLNQIHDELVLEVPEEYAEEAADLVKQYMEHPFGQRDALCVPIPISMKICSNWAEGK